MPKQKNKYYIKKTKENDWCLYKRGIRSPIFGCMSKKDAELTLKMSLARDAEAYT